MYVKPSGIVNICCTMEQLKLWMNLIFQNWISHSQSGNLTPRLSGRTGRDMSFEAIIHKSISEIIN